MPDLRGMDSYEIRVLDFLERVVFTTRDQAVCAEMGGDTFQMQCLGQDDAWDLFRYHVGDKIISYDQEIEYLAKQMVAECRGIPSALCTVALAMSNQSDCVLWRVAYELLAIKPPPTNDIQDKITYTVPRWGVLVLAAASKCSVWEKMLHGTCSGIVPAGDKLINSNPVIKGIAKKIAAECRGFPSALCLVGRSMSIQTDLCQWRLAYDMLLKIKRTLPTDIQEMSDKGYPCLQYFEGEFADLFLS